MVHHLARLLLLIVVLGQGAFALASTSWFYGQLGNREVALRLTVDGNSGRVTYLETPQNAESSGRHLTFDGDVTEDEDGSLRVQATTENGSHTIVLHVSVEPPTVDWSYLAEALRFAQTTLIEVGQESVAAEGVLSEIGTRIERRVALDDGSFEVTTSSPFFLAAPWSNLVLEPTGDDLAQSVMAGLALQSERDEMLNSTWWDDRFVEVTMLSNRLVSTRTHIYTYSGGAHPNTNYETHTWHLEADGWRELELCEAIEVLERPCNEALIRLYIMDELWEQAALWAIDGSMSGDEPWVLEAFTLTPVGVLFRYAPYLAGPYVQGTFDVLLRWDDPLFLANP